MVMPRKIADMIIRANAFGRITDHILPARKMVWRIDYKITRSDKVGDQLDR